MKGREAERIAMAVSNDMVTGNDGRRAGHRPPISISDAFITKMEELWSCFTSGHSGSQMLSTDSLFVRSGELDWEGDDLIAPSEPYDNLYAHKPCMIKHNDVVYHFYCAVNQEGERSIALATSKDLGKSTLKFPGN